MKKLFFLLILFAFGCSKADLQPSESFDSQPDDVTLYLLNVTGCPNASGCNGWVGISFPGYFMNYNLRNKINYKV